MRPSCCVETAVAFVNVMLFLNIDQTFDMFEVIFRLFMFTNMFFPSKSQFSLDVLLSSLCIISQAKLTHPGKIVQNVVWCWEQSKSCQMMGLRHSWIFLIAVEKVKVGSSVFKLVTAGGEVDDSAPDGRSHSDPDTLYILPIGSSNTQWGTLSDRLLMETVTWSEQWAAHMAPSTYTAV